MFSFLLIFIFILTGIILTNYSSNGYFEQIYCITLLLGYQFFNTTVQTPSSEV